MVLPSFKNLLLSTLVGCGLAGCASVPHRGDEPASFAEYAERVFRHQNQLTSRLMMLSDNELLPENDTFENAEQAMRDACHLLNEYAERENDGDSMGLFFKRRVQNSIADCDQSIQAMEKLLSGIAQH